LILFHVDNVFLSYFSVRITLLNDSSLVRAAGLRALRYMIKSEQHVAIMNKLQYPALIARFVLIGNFSPTFLRKKETYLILSTVTALSELVVYLPT
jgi:hypothetical protein